MTSDSRISARFHRIGYGLLCLSLGIAFLMRNHQTFYDEGSNLNLASGVLQGMHLYRDLFENHFPLPVYISAAIVVLAGKSLPLVRLAVFLIDAAVLLAVMRVSRLAFPIGFAAAMWACIGPYYFANMLLYDNLATLGGIALGAVCFAVLARGLEPSRGMFVLLALAGFAATLSSPFFALVTSIALASLWFAPQIPRSFPVKVSLAIAAPIAAYFLYLAATGAFGSFYSYAIRFNATTYQKYTPIHILPLIGKQLLLFDLFNQDWFRSLDPFHFNPVTFAPRFDHWIFSGLFYRVAALLACSLFLYRRNYRTALFLYLFAASLPLREDDGFHAAPFVFFCLFLVGVMVQQSSPLAMSIWMVPSLLLASSGARYVAHHALQSDFDRLNDEARLIRTAAQDRAGVQLGHYPYGNYMYYLTGLRPIGRFVDFYPWVAEIGRPEVDAGLARAPNVLLVMDLSGAIWTYPNAETLATELAYARKHLIREQLEWLPLYASPWLALQGGAGSEAAFTALAAPLAEGPVGIAGAWSKTSAGAPVPGTVYRSSGAGTLRLGPFPLAGHSAMALPVWTGPDNHNLSVTVRDVVSGKTLARLDPPPVRPGWWAWRPDLPQDPQLTFEIIAASQNQGAEAWMALGWPHWLRPSDPAHASRPGLYRNGDWRLDAATGAVLHLGGNPGDVPVTGDWNGSGKTRPGIYRSMTGEWILAGTQQTYHFGGQPGDVPVTGDWDGSGRTRPGIFRPATGEWRFFGIAASIHFAGSPGDLPVTGDWSGTGKTQIGFYKPSNGEWRLYGVDGTFHFGGIPGDLPVVGDWNGDGRSKPGIFRRGTAWLLDMDGNYKFEDLGTDTVINFGSPGDQPVAGRW